MLVGAGIDLVTCTGKLNCLCLAADKDGAMSVGWHADDERLFQGKASDIRIISLSLGCTRRFSRTLKSTLIIGVPKSDFCGSQMGEKGGGEEGKGGVRERGHGLKGKEGWKNEGKRGPEKRTRKTLLTRYPYDLGTL